MFDFSSTGGIDLQLPANQKFKQVTLNHLPGKYDPFLVKWYAIGSLILVGFNNAENSKQELYLFDSGLNLLKIQLPNGDIVDALYPSLLIGKYARFKTVEFLTTTASNQVRLLCIFERGPISLLTIHCSCAFTHKTMVGMHLMDHNPANAYNIVRNLTNPDHVLETLVLLGSYLLKNANKTENAELLDSILQKFAPIFGIYGSLGTFKFAFYNIFKRYFFICARSGYFEKAFQIAHELNSEELFEELVRQALDNNMPMIAYMSFLKTSSTFQQQMNNKIGALSQATGIVQEWKQLKDRKSLSELLLKYRKRGDYNDKKFTPEEQVRLAAYLEVEGELKMARQLYAITPVQEERVNMLLQEFSHHK